MHRISVFPAVLLIFAIIGSTGSAQTTDFQAPPRTLFEWPFGPETVDEPDDEEDTIVTDRPDFTEASTNVGLGRIQLEAGYTYFRDNRGGARLNGHSYPEILLRAGILAEWLELRIGQNFASETTRGPDGKIRGNGAEDLYLGLGVNLTEQKGIFPEMRVLFQTLLPTGSRDLSNDAVLPGINLIYSWEVNDFISMAGSTQANRARDDVRDFYVEFAQSFTIGYSLTDRLGAYTEWFALMPSGAEAPDTTAQHFFNGGFTFLATNNLQFDIRAGIGLNESADDFFAGAGFAYRY